MFNSDISSYETSVAYIIETKPNSRILSKRRLKKCFPNFPVSKNSLHVQKLQNMTNRAHWPDYHHSFLFPRNHFHSKWYESKKTLRKSCLDCWFFCILKPSTKFFRFEKIARLKIHPAGKNNFNASSKSSTTPYDRWVQAILHKDCRVETRNKNHDEGPHKSPDAAKFHQCWNNWSRWSIIITQPYLFDLAVGSTRTVTLTSLLVNRQTLLGGLRGFGIEVRALNTDVSSGAP